MTEERMLNHSGYSAYLNERKLMGSRCLDCGEVYLPPRSLCTHCYSTHMAWMQFSGEGQLAGFTTIYVGLPAMVSRGYNRENPYCVGVVRLVEGPSISGRIQTTGCAFPEEVKVGLPVRAVFVEHGSGADRQVTLAFAEWITK